MTELDLTLQGVLNVSREVGFIRGMDLAAALVRRAGHTGLAEKLLQLCLYDGLVHLDHEARIAIAESIKHA